MSKPVNHLVMLIKSLSKAEKRHFKVYARRTFGEKDMKFLILFDLYDKYGEVSHEVLKKKLPDTKDSALSNLKAHLYEQLLISLRLQHHLDPAIRLDELMSFARVLALKGLYAQSLEQLRKAKLVATGVQNDTALYTIVEMERQIELFFVTESGDGRAQEIIQNNQAILEVISSRDDWSNLALLLYDYYLKFGHVKNQRQFVYIENYFNSEVAKIKSDGDCVSTSIYRDMANTWYYFITQNFSLCYKNASVWVKKMNANDQLLKKDPIMYLKGVHNILSALFYSNKPKQFEKHLGLLSNYIAENESDFTKSVYVTAKIYLFLGKLNHLFLQGTFRGNQVFVDSLNVWLDENSVYVSENRMQIFRYKIACLYFGADDFKQCVYYLNQIINSSTREVSLRQDVQCFSRILNLVAHYELGNHDLLDYQLKSTYRFLLKYGDLQKVQLLIIDFIRKSVYMDRSEMIPYFKGLNTNLTEVLKDPYEQRPLLYLDLISWLTSRIENQKVEDIIRARQKNR